MTCGHMRARIPSQTPRTWSTSQSIARRSHADRRATRFALDPNADVIVLT
jgi:hypothetical protein